MILDALGNPIVNGSLYGYHRCTNGVTHNLLGRSMSADSIKKTVRLEVLSTYASIYENNVELKKTTQRTTTIRANRLFRVVEQ